MATIQDPDLKRSASHRHMIAQLTGPFQAGAVDTPVPINENGQIDIGWTTREPLLLAAPKVALGTQQFVLETTLPEGKAVRLQFAPYTEAGAFLPLYRPPVEATTQTAAPFTLSLHLRMEGDEAFIDPAEHLEVRLLEGLMGRMIYLLGAEKQRLRRQGREIMAMRRLPLARDNALDRLGAELGVPRFNETIHFLPPEEIELPATFGEFRFGDRRFGPGSWGRIVTRPGREADADYRRRLAIYRPFLIPNWRQVVRWLNGPGEAPELPRFPPEPNRGWLSELGLTHRFRITEADNDFAFAIHLIAAGDEAYRDNFLEHIRRCHLIWPSSNSTANDIHAARYWPEAKQAQIEALRHRLSQAFEFDSEAAIAPMLAVALDRVARCRRSLDVTTRWPILRAQDSRSGSRYELGLGVDVPLMAPAELDRMAELLRESNFSLPEAADPEEDPNPQETEGLLRSMTPLPASEDPEGHWLLEACGLRTVHRVQTSSSDYLYLSHLPIFGMAITGPSRVDLGEQTTLEFRYYPPGDTEGSVLLQKGLKAAEREWVRRGGETWTVLPWHEALEYWERVIPPPENVARVFRAAGLTVIPSLGITLERVLEGLRNLPGAERKLVTLRLPRNLTRQILSGEFMGIAGLRGLATIFSNHGLTSVLPLVSDRNEVLLVVSIARLTEADPSPAERRALNFRWYVVPIGTRGTGGGRIAISENPTTFTPKKPGLSALIAVGYARLGLTDPYEFRVELPDTARLNLLQYEFLMNVLQQVHPIGIGVNTFNLRQHHVDLDDDGTPEPLQPMISRTYRQFRRRRYRGETYSTLNTD